MADAKICDRCGDYYGADEESDSGAKQLYITAEPVATVVVTSDDINRNDSIAHAVRNEPSVTKRPRVETKDLCSDCYEAFLDYWNDGGGA